MGGVESRETKEGVNEMVSVLQSQGGGQARRGLYLGDSEL